MGAVTYPEPAVGETISQRFIPVQINTQDGAGAEVIDRYRQVWTPDLRVLGADGFEYDGWNGYLPPFEFIPRLLLGQGHALLRQRRDLEAADIFDDVLRRFPTSHAAPEAAYYLAVARYRHSHDASDLLGNWEQLRLRYPESVWRLKQSMLEGDRS
jgi:hypothetical protein